MDLEDGALMEPLSVGVHATKRGEVQIGDVVLIFGAGPIGLVTLLSAKAKGASKIIITDILEVKLEKAKELGAHHTIKIEKDMKEDDVVEKIKELLGEEPNKTFDCSGAEFCVRIALKVTKSKGIVVLVGMGKFEQTLPLASAIFREVDIRGVFRYNNDYPTAIDMVSTGKISVKPLITHHYKIEDSLEAFETAKTQKGDPIKILIHANPNWKPS
jgi:L-iditol 2-dehydrogenase